MDSDAGGAEWIGQWIGWLAGFAISSLLAVGVAWRYGTASPTREDEKPLPLALRAVAWALLIVPFVLGILVVLEFIKDDAYISFRYAHNLVTGHGLVFNWGEKLEGFTNFAWVLLLSPFEALGLDLFQVCEVLGTALGIGCVLLTMRMTEWLGFSSRSTFLAPVWGAAWLATSSSFVLWAKSGLEQPLATFLPICGALMLWQARERAQTTPGRKAIEQRYLAAGVLLGVGCMTRPEIHLLAILVGLPLVFDALRHRRIRRADALYVVGILAVTVPCHTFRLLYYGTLIPNTFYVKTGRGWAVWAAGVSTLHDMFEFNATGALVVLAPMAFASKRHAIEKATSAIIAVAFMVYYVSVGVDEMQWHRLYLPALPFLCVLGALGLQNLAERLAAATSSGRIAAYGVAWFAVIFACAANFQFTYQEQGGFNGHGDLAGTYHPDLGKFLVRHERPGALVAFQDMGSTPYHAPDIQFLDFFGLVDKTVAHARHDDGLHAFVGSSNAGMQAKFDADMRNYFFDRNPEWAILTIYTPRGQESRVFDEYSKDPTGAAFGDDYRQNGWQFGIYDDPRFRKNYVPVRTWPRSSAYYLALWRRRDLWEQTPREVVLDAPPAEMGGVRASFEGGLELMGSSLTTETVERGEAFVTTWWKVPGPMPRDVTFFVHFNTPKLQIPADHVPGDWMYPADRWQPGQIIEDRMLFQVPPIVMPAGTYNVSLGAYRRSTGERLKILSGPNDGSERLLLGQLKVDTLLPLVEPLIPPTHVAQMRKYPDRIVDSLRSH